VATNDETEAYWTHYRLSQGDRRERLLSDDYFWAWEDVDFAVTDGPVDEAVKLLDSLLRAPSADPCYVGAGPLENLLRYRPAEAATVVATLVRQEPLWREAFACAHPG